MTTPTYAELKAGLTEDIESMRLQIMRLENQILKNEIVLKEVEVHERCMAALKRTMLEDLASLPSGIIVDSNKKPVAINTNEATGTVPDMVKAYLDTNPRSDGSAQFSHGDIIHWASAKHPTVPLDKIRQGVYSAVTKLKKDGVIMGAGKGWMKLKQ